MPEALLLSSASASAGWLARSPRPDRQGSLTSRSGFVKVDERAPGVLESLARLSHLPWELHLRLMLQYTVASRRSKSLLSPA